MQEETVAPKARESWGQEGCIGPGTAAPSPFLPGRGAEARTTTPGQQGSFWIGPSLSPPCHTQELTPGTDLWD